MRAAPPETSEPDFDQFVFSGRGKPSQLITLWKFTEEELEKEMRADIAWQQQLVHEAAIFQQQIAVTDQQIDRLVYELYGLTEDEIKIVEGKLQGYQ